MNLVRTIWNGIDAVPPAYYVTAAICLAGYGVFRAAMRFRRRRGSIRPLHYFSYITHSSLPSVCARCGVEVPERRKKHCLSNPQKFGGMVYCDRHQRAR